MIASAVYFDEGYFGRRVQAGIASYARESKRKRWKNMVAIPPELYGSDLLDRYVLDGLIVAICDHGLDCDIASKKMPAVHVIDYVPDLGHPSVVVDDYLVGEKAGEYFLDRGYQNFGFLIESGHGDYALLRGKGFTASIGRAGYEVSWFGHWPEELPDGGVRGEASIREWLEGLPKPVAIFASEDRTAVQLYDSALALKLKLPEQVAILGADNDPEMHYMHAGISSMELPFWQVGYQAAEVLDQLLDGVKPKEWIRYLPPGNIITRASSDALQTNNLEVMNALRFIREHAVEFIDVDTVSEAVSVGRRTLERHFRQATGQTLKNEIRRMKIQHAMKLLLNSNLSPKEIAPACGFRSHSYFFKLFQRVTKLTPMEYRKKNA